MKKRKIIKLLLIIVFVELIIVAGICIRDSMAQSDTNVTVRQVPPRTVLYTVYRGPYDMIGGTINRLFELAGYKGLCPSGPVTIGYLNDPTSVSPDHWLIEIRLPVDDAAIELAGMLGPMTDVKRLPAMKVAVAVKPQGEFDPGYAINNLQLWLERSGYVTIDRLWQSVVTNRTGDYTQMETEFILPIEKSPSGVESVFKVRSVALY